MYKNGKPYFGPIKEFHGKRKNHKALMWQWVG